MILYTCGTVDVLNPNKLENEIRVRIMDEVSPGNDKHHYVFTSKGIQMYTPKAEQGGEPVVEKNVSSSAPSVEETKETDDSPESIALVKRTREELASLWKAFEEKGETEDTQLKTKLREVLDKAPPSSLGIIARKLGCSQSTFQLWMESPRMSKKSYVGEKLGSWLFGSE